MDLPKERQRKKKCQLTLSVARRCCCWKFEHPLEFQAHTKQPIVGERERERERASRIPGTKHLPQVEIGRKHANLEFRSNSKNEIKLVRDCLRDSPNDGEGERERVIK